MSTASEALTPYTPGSGRNPSAPAGIGLLIGQAFFIGLAFGLLYNVAYTLLVLEFGSAGLRTVYVLAGVIIPLFTVVFNWLEEHMPLSKFGTGTVLTFAILFFALYPLLLIPDASWIIYVLMVVNTMGSLYCMMLRGAQAAEMYDARTIKAQYPRITGAEILAVVLAGILVVPLSQLLGSLEALLLLGGVSMLVAAVFVHLIGVRHLAHEEHLAHLSEERHHAHEHGFSALKAIISKRYTLLVFGYQLISSAVSLLVQYLVYSEAQNFFPEQAELSRFIGLIKAGTTGLSFLFLIFVAGRLLLRFGMPLGVAGSPLGGGVVLVLALIAGMIEDGTGRAFFILIVATQFVDYMAYSGFAKTSVQSAFQPLPTHEREAVHTFAQGIGIPLSYGVTGVLLMLFAQVPGFRTSYAVYLTLGVMLLCGLVGIGLYRAYGSALRRSLSRRRVEAVDLSLNDASTLEILEKLLASGDPWQVRSGLNLLEEAGHDSYEDRLRELVAHENPEIRRDVLERIERVKPQWATDLVMRLLERERDDAVVGAAIRSICALVDEPVTTVGEYLDADSRQLRSAAVAGLFLYGGINGILEAGNVFNRLASSPNSGERIDAANILERVAIRNFYHPLVDLLNDDDERVVLAALRAAREVAHPALLPEVIRHVDPVNTRAEALSTLIAFGDDVTRLLHDCLTGSAELERETIFRIIRASARISGGGITAELEAALEHEDRDIAEVVYEVLSQRGYRATAVTRPTIRRLLDRYTEETARIVMALWEVSQANGIEPLVGALDDSYRRHLESIFLLLTFIYDADDVLGIRRRIVEGTNKERALGLELLDVMLAGELKQRVLAVAEHPVDCPPSTDSYGELFGLRRMSPEQRVTEILEDRRKWPEPWMRVCAHHAAWALGLQDEKPEETVLTTIERVLALKAADIFAGIPDNVLAHIASIGEDVDVPAKETFIRKGEIGNSMYIIREGRVAIHDETTRFAELSAGEVVGEMAVLDPEPRSASVTALEETMLLKIEKEAFDSVMVDHPGIARGVIQVLCRRLRHTIQKAG